MIALAEGPGVKTVQGEAACTMTRWCRPAVAWPYSVNAAAIAARSP